MGGVVLEDFHGGEAEDCFAGAGVERDAVVAVGGDDAIRACEKHELHQLRIGQDVDEVGVLRACLSTDLVG